MRTRLPLRALCRAFGDWPRDVHAGVERVCGSEFEEFFHHPHGSGNFCPKIWVSAAAKTGDRRTSRPGTWSGNPAEEIGRVEESKMIGQRQGMGVNRPGDRFSSIRFRDLDPELRRLAEMILSIHYGRIDGLVIRQGRPDWTHRVDVTREMKFPKEYEHRAAAWFPDSYLKTPIAELIDELKRIPDGMKISIEIKGQLPFRLFVQTSE